MDQLKVQMRLSGLDWKLGEKKPMPKEKPLKDPEKSWSTTAQDD